jgi:hypothetical protein
LEQNKPLLRLLDRNDSMTNNLSQLALAVTQKAQFSSSLETLRKEINDLRKELIAVKLQLFTAELDTLLWGLGSVLVEWLSC